MRGPSAPLSAPGRGSLENLAGHRRRRLHRRQLRARGAGPAAIRVVNLDALTYAGNLDTLAARRRRPAPRVRARRHRRPRAGRRAAARAPAATRSSTSPPRATSTARSTARRLRAHQRRRHVRRCSRRRATTGRRSTAASATASASSTCPPTRSTARSATTGDFTEDDAATRRTRPYSARKAATDHLVRAYHHTFGLPVLITNCSNNYGPLPVPREADPADDPQRARAASRCRSTATARTCATGCTSSDHCAAIRTRARARAASARPTTSAATTSGRTSTWCKTICALLDERRPRADGEPRESLITYVTDRPGHDRRYAIDAAQAQARARLGADARPSRPACARRCDWYLENQALGASACSTASYRMVERTTAGRAHDA